jgi:hypothetical protein
LMVQIEVVTGILLPTCLLVLFMFLPSIIELKKPRDAGPRLIHTNFKTGFANSKSTLIDVETGLVTGQLTMKGSIFPSYIYNIEA